MRPILPPNLVRRIPASGEACMHAKQMSLNITYRRVVNHFCKKILAQAYPAHSPSAPRTACGFACAPSSLAGPAARAAAVWTQSRFGQPRSAAPSKTAPPYMGAVCKLDPAGFGSSQRTEAASHFSFPKSRASVLFSLGSCSTREERHDLARAVSCSGSRPVRAGVGAAAPAAR